MNVFKRIDIGMGPFNRMRRYAENNMVILCGYEYPDNQEQWVEKLMLYHLGDKKWHTGKCLLPMAF